MLLEFIETNDRVFVLRGYAGTGKTTLVKTFIDELSERKHEYKLLASTGRAAKILSNITGCPATTVHSMIYKFQDFNQDLEKVVKQQEETGVDDSGQVYLTFQLVTLPPGELEVKRFYIVDESSMIADMVDLNISQAAFGSGRLLKDLLDYDPVGKFIFVGDHGQLPPVDNSKAKSFSPALSIEYLKQNFDLQGVSFDLTEIMRQVQGNDIIAASKRIRHLFSNVPGHKWSKLPLKGYRDILIHSDSISMLKDYIEMIKDNNYNNATLITYYNKRTSDLTELIRPALRRNRMLEKGDLLLITQNNLPTGLMNGDMVVVTQVNNEVKRNANLTFRGVELKELFTGRTYSHLLIEELIYSNETNLNNEQQKKLFIDFFTRMSRQKIKQKTLAFNHKMRTDPFLNALRAVYGYAITCHKAQGGEWDHVFLDIPRNITLNATEKTFQWVYTAMTRAKVQLHVVNDFYIE